MNTSIPTTEYRVVCVEYPRPGHGRHVHDKASLTKAIQSVIDLGHHADMHPTLWYAREAPWRVQARVVEPWTDAEVSADG